MSDPNTGDAELIARLRKDILKTGFPTEMAVANVMSEAGWIPLDHTYFMDRDENKGREIDIYALRQGTSRTDKKQVFLTIGLAVEIKKSASAPWVVFTSNKLQNFDAQTFFDTSLARMHSEEIWFRDLYRNHPINAVERIGRASYIAFKNKKGDNRNDVAEQEKRQAGLVDDSYMVQNFGAFVSAFKATNEIIGQFRQADKAPLRDPNNNNIKTYHIGIAHGLVVVDGQLFEAQTRSKDDVDIQAAKSIPFAFNYASKEYGNRTMLIDVITFDHVAEYLKRYSEWLDERAQFCLRELS